MSLKAKKILENQRDPVLSENEDEMRFSTSNQKKKKKEKSKSGHEAESLAFSMRHLEM